MKKLYNIRSFLFTLIVGLCVIGCSAITGKETAGEYIDDTSITTKVKTAIFGAPDLAVGEISVETLKGEVQLSGFVNTAIQKSRAEEYAARVKGVKSIKNHIIVRGYNSRVN